MMALSERRTWPGSCDAPLMRALELFPWLRVGASPAQCGG